MANTNLPNIVSTLTDGNLDTSRVVDLGDSILIIGTSSRGPVNQPVRITSLESAQRIFGPATKGTLVRGFSEVYFSPGGNKDIRLCRLSNGKVASLALEESSSVVLENLPTYVNEEAVTALTIEANEPGDIYNSVTFRSEIVDGQLSVIGYNPVTEVETVIPYDPTGVTTGSVSDVTTLANAINLDSNLGGIVSAEVNELNMTGTFTLTDDDVAASGTIATALGDTIVLDLGEALDTDDTGDDGYGDGVIVAPSGIPVTSGNRTIRLNSVYELDDILVELDTAGKSSVQLDYPSQVLTGTTTAKPFLDMDGEVSGAGVGIHLVVDSYIGTGDASTKAFSFTAYEAIDPDTFVLKRTSASGSTITVDASQYTLTMVGGSVNAYIAMVTFATLAAAPATSSILTVTYDSEEFSLTQVTTLQACILSSSYKTYFVAGDTITWGTAQPCDIRIYYSAKKTYDIDVDVTIYDAAKGQVHFTNPDKQPSYTDDAGTEIYIDWDYQPEWVNLSSGARALQGGSNGIIMNNAVKYKLLTACYTALADYEADCVVLMNTYLDDTKTIYDSETGVPVSVNAGFAYQFETYLASLQDGVNETYGVIAVKGATSAKLEDITDWYTNLTTVSTSDLTAAANVMVTADYRHISIVAFEPVVSNQAVSFPYVTTGEAIYAGMLIKLPISSGPTNKSLGSQVIACRYKLSARQLDALTGGRFVTTKLDTNGEWKITDGVTAAALTSDYTRWTTLKITFESMDVVRSIGKPFIGELFNPAKKAALETGIQKGLMMLKDAGALRNFDFKIEQTAQERAAGIARIPLILYPEFELRRIETIVTLSNA